MDRMPWRDSTQWKTCLSPESVGTDCSAVEDVSLRAGDLGCLRPRTHFVEEKTEVPPKHDGDRVGWMQFDSKYHGLGAEVGAIPSSTSPSFPPNSRASFIFIQTARRLVGLACAPSHCVGAWLPALSHIGTTLLLAVVLKVAPLEQLCLG